MHNKITSFLIVLTLLAAPAAAQEAVAPGLYALDPETAQMSVTARRFLMSPAVAEFHDITGELTISEDGRAQLEIKIAAGDLTANSDFVERLLTGESFLNATAYPTMMFVAVGFEITSEPQDIPGELTMAGITHPATFSAQLLEPGSGMAMLSYTAEGRVRRSNWGMTAYRGVVGERIAVALATNFVLTDPEDTVPPEQPTP